MTQRCNNCRHWLPEPASGQSGECRANPPACLAIGGQLVTRWPRTDSLDFCGCHQPERAVLVDISRNTA
jgi:hypothetical protein